MSQAKKALAKLQKKPPPKDFTWDDLVTIMKSLGFTVVNGAGSRRHFVRTIDGKSVRFSQHEPHPSGILKTYVIEQACEWLKEKGLI